MCLDGVVGVVCAQVASPQRSHDSSDAAMTASDSAAAAQPSAMNRYLRRKCSDHWLENACRVAAHD